MAYVKKNLTPEERSAIARANAAKRKKFGPSKGTKYKAKTPDKVPEERKTVGMLSSAYAVYVRYAHVHGMTLLEAMSSIADSLVKQDECLRSPVVIHTV